MAQRDLRAQDNAPAQGSDHYCRQQDQDSQGQQAVVGLLDTVEDLVPLDIAQDDEERQRADSDATE